MRTFESVLVGCLIDSFARARLEKDDLGEMKRLVNELLIQIDNMPNHVLLIGASNMPESLDAALVRRFQICIACNSPEQKHIYPFIVGLLNRHGIDDLNANEIHASLPGNTSYAEIEHICINRMRSHIVQRQRGLVGK